MARTARVGFEPNVRSRRAPREDELSVMRTFARHASHCDDCYDPYRTWKRGGELCDRGHLYARDVAKYIYSKGGLPFSLLDRQAYGERTEIEIPVGYEVIRDLTKAFQQGLELKTKKAIVSHDKHYYVPDRREKIYINDERGRGVEIRPSSSKSSRREREHYYREPKPVVVTDKRGSLYFIDEEAKQSRKQYDEDPLVIIADPRRRYRR